jgi:hypothetical protein
MFLRDLKSFWKVVLLRALKMIALGPTTQRPTNTHAIILFTLILHVQ